MGFDEKIGDHIPELVREFVTLCITEFVSVDGGGLYKISAFEGRRLGFLEFRTEASKRLRSWNSFRRFRP